MNWIKQNYDQFILVLVALGLLVLSGFLINNAMSFSETFSGIRDEGVHHNDVVPVDMSKIEDAAATLEKSGKWDIGATPASLFISLPYIDMSGTLVNPSTSSIQLHKPVPNKWVMDHKLDILDNNVLTEDPDGDGFTNLDEWKGVKGDGSDSTDPQDKSSHPPYYTKLRLVQYVKQPFRLLFNAYDGDSKKPEEMNFQINTIDIKQPSQFLKIGDMISGTKFKIIKFEEKHEPNPSSGSVDDVSELTVQNTETQDNVVLVLARMVNSPDSYALFEYLWSHTRIRVQKNKEFALQPEANLRYKLIDIKEDEALIQTPTGQQVRVPRGDQP